MRPDGIDGSIVLLGLLPGFEIDQEIGEVFVELAIGAQMSDVDWIAKHVGISFDRSEDMERVMDSIESGALGAQLESAADLRGLIGIDNPAGGQARGTVTMLADLDRLAHIAEGRFSTNAAKGLAQMFLATAHVAGQVDQVALVKPIDGGFEEATFGSGWYGVFERVDLVATPAQIGAIELGIVEIAGEPAEFPDDHAGFSGVIVEMDDHFLELLTPAAAGSGQGLVFEDVGQAEAIGGAPGADDLLLLFEGRFLFRTSTISTVKYNR